VYYQGQLIYGVEPAAAGMARQSGTSPAPEKLQVIVQENPVVGEQAEVKISGAAGQPLQLTLMDFEGSPLATQHVAAATDGQLQRVPVSNLRPGVYLLKVTSADQSSVVRLLKQ
jgi:hypothetical protein